jgi:hypothetical protein
MAIALSYSESYAVTVGLSSGLTGTCPHGKGVKIAINLLEKRSHNFTYLI